MTQRATINRPVSVAEVAVLRASIERAAKLAGAELLIPTLDALRAVGRCECGCDTVDFAAPSRAPGSQVADGIGTTPNGGAVGVIVWGTLEGITSLEVYDLGAGDDDLRLPTPESIHSWATDTA